jgi:hypothetical protein
VIRSECPEPVVLATGRGAIIDRQAPGGLIHMSYTFRRRTIKYSSFDESWIKGGGTLGLFTGDHL